MDAREDARELAPLGLQAARLPRTHPLEQLARRAVVRIELQHAFQRISRTPKVMKRCKGARLAVERLDGIWRELPRHLGGGEGAVQLVQLERARREVEMEREA